MTRDELLALPAVVDLRTACRALGIGKTVGYQLAKAGDFPCPVLRLGTQYRVPTAGLLQLLSLATPEAASEPALNMSEAGPASPATATAEVSEGPRHAHGNAATRLRAAS